MNNDFLPTGYELPVSGGNYMKLEKGENIFRVLSSAIVGFEYWTVENKPIRAKKIPEQIPMDMKKDSNWKHFWAFVVWNYKSQKIQILEITQSSIQSAITNLVEDVDWGSPKGYDIKIARTGDGLETEYAISPKPHMPLKEDIKQLLANTPVDLENLFTGADPFKPVNSDGSKVPTF